jgi:hypothetical protein
VSRSKASKVLIGLILFLGSCSSIPVDKRKHFIAGAVSSGIVVTLTDDPKAGCIAAAAVGVGKEVYDSKTHSPDPKDALATTLGCLVWYYIKK